MVGWWEAWQFGNYTISAQKHFLITHWIQLNEYFLFLFAFNKNSKGSIYEVRSGKKPKQQILFHSTQCKTIVIKGHLWELVFLLTLCTSCTWLPLLGVLPSQGLSSTAAMPEWDCGNHGLSVSTMHEQGASAACWRSLPWLWEAAAPTHISQMRKEAPRVSASCQGQVALSGRAGLKTQVCLVPELMLLWPYHPFYDFASTCSLVNFFLAL